jgi:uncharacterized Tic20 family protein
MEEQVPATPTISFGDIVMNLFTSPGDAYEGIRTSPSRGSVWIVPMIVAILLGCVYSWAMFSNDAIKSQFMDSRREQMQEQVRSGKITQDQADQGMDRMEKAGGMMIAFAIIAVAVITPIVIFVGALVLWLFGKYALKAEPGYGKYLELWGASQWVGILGAIVTILMMLALTSMYATPSASLAVLGTYNPLNSTHRLLGALNIFSIWQMVVVGIGLSKFSGKSAGTGIGVSAGLWIVWIIISVFGFAAMGMG